MNDKREYPEVSKEQVCELLEQIDSDFTSWVRAGSSEDGFTKLLNTHLKSYQLIQNSSTQTELNEIVDRYEWAYPLFQTMNDAVDGKLQ